MNMQRQRSAVGAFLASEILHELQNLADLTGGYCRIWPAGDLSCEVEEWNFRAFADRLALTLVEGKWMSRTAEQIISAAEAHIQTAKFGLDDLKSHTPEKKTPGLLNVAVFGRSATFALQNLKSIVPEFEEWYRGKQSEFASDELMKYFNGLRRKIEHEAHAPKVCGVRIQHLSTSDMQKHFGAAPPNAVGQFIGDSQGRSGWIVRAPDGTEEHYYVDLPGVRPLIVLEDAPGAEKDAANLAAKYISTVEAVIAEARQKFIR